MKTKPVEKLAVIQFVIEEWNRVKHSHMNYNERMSEAGEALEKIERVLDQGEQE